MLYFRIPGVTPKAKDLAGKCQVMTKNSNVYLADLKTIHFAKEELGIGECLGILFSFIFEHPTA